VQSLRRHVIVAVHVSTILTSTQQAATLEQPAVTTNKATPSATYAKPTRSTSNSNSNKNRWKQIPAACQTPTSLARSCPAQTAHCVPIQRLKSPTPDIPKPKTRASPLPIGSHAAFDSHFYRLSRPAVRRTHTYLRSCVTVRTGVPRPRCSFITRRSRVFETQRNAQLRPSADSSFVFSIFGPLSLVAEIWLVRLVIADKQHTILTRADDIQYISLYLYFVGGDGKDDDLPTRVAYVGIDRLNSGCEILHIATAGHDWTRASFGRKQSTTATTQHLASARFAL